MATPEGVEPPTLRSEVSNPLLIPNKIIRLPRQSAANSREELVRKLIKKLGHPMGRRGLQGLTCKLPQKDCAPRSRHM
jgi:hypothetical protein